MRSLAVAIVLLFLAVLSPAAAQDEGRREDALEKRFKTLDKDGDGKVSAGELGNADLFERLDLDAKRRVIENAKPFANEDGKPVWFAYPRWTSDESAIVYHAGGKLFLYEPASGSTTKVSTDDAADHRYPHGEAAPK